MPSPTPIYTVSYDSLQLPGYVQSEDGPIILGSNIEKVFGRDGGINTPTGANLRSIQLQMLLISSLDVGTGMEHLDNVRNQYREAAAILTRPFGENELVIHDTDRYYMAKVDRISAPQTADTSSRKLRYTVDFTAQPWAISTVAQTESFSGNGTVTVSGMTGSRRTYPILVVPDTVDTFTADDEHGHTIQFDRGAFTSTITIDCAKMEANRPNNPAMTTMLNLNFGCYYDPLTDGDDLVLTVTGFTGSGSVTVNVPKRYEL